MEVVGKDHVASDCNAEIILRASAKSHECFMKTIIREISPTSIGATGYEINWPVRKDDIQPTRGSREFCHESV